MGMSIKRNTTKDEKTGNISTTYELQKSDGSTEKKTLSEIRDFIYERSESATPKKTPKAADDGEWRSTKDGGKIFIGPGGDQEQDE